MIVKRFVPKRDGTDTLRHRIRQRTNRICCKNELLGGEDQFNHKNGDFFLQDDHSYGEVSYASNGITLYICDMVREEYTQS